MIILRKNLKELEDNVVKVKEMKTDVFSNEDLNSLNGSLDYTVNKIKESGLLTYKGSERICYNDLIKLNFNTFTPSNDISLLSIIAKYDESVKNYIEVYKSSWISYAFGGNEAQTKPMLAYQYNTYDLFSQSTVLDVKNANVIAIIYWLNDLVVKTNYIAKTTLDIGGAINE